MKVDSDSIDHILLFIYHSYAKDIEYDIKSKTLMII